MRDEKQAEELALRAPGNTCSYRQTNKLNVIFSRLETAGEP